MPRRHCGVRRSDGSEPDYISPTQRIQAHLAATVTITSINMPDSNSSASTPDHAATSRRRPIPRKGHTKSRAGCPNCKRRKVKCDEVAPECGPCRRLGLGCEYAGGRAGPVVAVTPPAPAPLPSAAAAPTSTGPFDMSDLRFFQHFLLCAYPPLPIGGWSVWQLVSQMSHEVSGVPSMQLPTTSNVSPQYEFLVHAMLGLGASHLSLLTPAGYVKDALRHRVAAIKLLNEFLARGPHTTANVDAAFAAILSLTYQAAHMPDGLYDFLTMTRGCKCLVLTVCVRPLTSRLPRRVPRGRRVSLFGLSHV